MSFKRSVMCVSSIWWRKRVTGDKSFAFEPASNQKTEEISEAAIGLGAHGNHYDCADVYDEMVASNHFPVRQFEGKTYPPIEEDVDAANVVLNLSTLTNGKLTVRTYENMENLRMLTLSRGCEPCWMSEVDADRLGIKDNDWVEVYNVDLRRTTIY